MSEIVNQSFISEWPEKPARRNDQLNGLIDNLSHAAEWPDEPGREGEQPLGSKLGGELLEGQNRQVVDLQE